MAELGLLANLVGVVGAGLRLSLMLYEAASTFGSAGKEIRLMASDVSLFCSVLKQVHSMLTKAKAFRLSITAGQTTQDIIDRCQSIFDEIKEILDRLCNGSDGTVDVLSRVKWTFKKSKVLVLRESLRSFTAMLHLMLTTIDFAQNIASRRKSTAETDLEDKQQRELVHTLVLAQQTANDQLEEQEEKTAIETNSTKDSSSQSSLAVKEPTEPVSPGRRPNGHKRHRSSHFINRTVYDGSGATDPTEYKRTSLLLNQHLFGEGTKMLENRISWLSPPDHRSSVVQSDSLLRKWTDQADPLSSIDNEGEEATDLKAVEKLPLWEQYREEICELYAHQHRNLDDIINAEELQDNLKEWGVWDSATEAQNLQHTVLDQQNTISDGTQAFVRRPPEEVRTFRVSMTDPCYKVLPAVLKKYSIDADWRDYALYIVYEGKERYIGLEEKPLLLFKALSREGRDPMFMPRRLANPAEDRLYLEGSKVSVVVGEAPVRFPGGVF
ncbi:Adaptor for signal transduction [Trapelia coarctata]|nr:Adaptor for signal transduction [Trapelia coarctata]